MIAEVTITLSDYVLEQISGVLILSVGFTLGYIWSDQKIVREFRLLIQRRRARRAAR